MKAVLLRPRRSWASAPAASAWSRESGGTPGIRRSRRCGSAAIVKARNHNRPPLVNPNSFRLKPGIRPGWAIDRRSKKFRASKAALRTNSNTLPCKSFHPGFGDDLRIPRRSMPDFRRQHTRARFNFPDRVHVEVRERRPAHLRVGCVDAIHRKHGGAAALSVDRELLREVRGSRSSGLVARRQQQQLAEVALVERQQPIPACPTKSSPPAACVCGCAASEPVCANAVQPASRSTVIDRNRFIRKEGPSSTSSEYATFQSCELTSEIRLPREIGAWARLT